MNARLRAQHRSIFVVLGAALPALVAAAVIRRPKSVQEPGAAPGLEEWSAVAPVAGEPPRLSIDGLRARVALPPDWNEPDALLYLLPRGARAARSVPAEALFLGVVRSGGPRSFALPALPEPPETGALLLYSLAHQEILATSGALAEAPR